MARMTTPDPQKWALSVARKALRAGEREAGRDSELYAKSPSTASRRRYKIGYEGLLEVERILAGKR